MEPHVTTATTHDDFLGKLSSMLHQPNTEEHKLARIAYARENRWVERGLKAYQVIRQAILDKGMNHH